MFNFVTKNQVICFSNGYVSVSPDSVVFVGESKLKEHSIRIRITSSVEEGGQKFARLEFMDLMGNWGMMDQLMPDAIQTKPGTNNMAKGVTWEENLEADIDRLIAIAIRYAE